LRNPRKNGPILALFTLLLAGLLCGVYELLVLRFRVGDVYPHYSSLRTDPMGTKALFDGLADQKGLEVTRSYKPLDKIERVPETALFDLGEKGSEGFDAPAEEYKDLEKFLTDGGRLVLSLVGDPNANGENPGMVGRNPLAGRSYPQATPVPTQTEAPTATPAKPPSQVVSVATPGHTPPPSLGKVWGLQVGFQQLPKTVEEGAAQDRILYQPVTVLLDKGGSAGSAAAAHLPPELSWHSGYYFEGLDPAWRVLYRRGDHPVVIERSWGKGELVFFSDSYLVSNEAMEADRQPGFLAYLPGDKRRLLFDETHLGVQEEDNMANLMAQYGLGGVLLGLLLLALLFIWRNMSSLAPPPPDESGVEAGGKSGKDFSSGMVNLLRRNIPAGEVLSVCFALWKKHQTPAGGRSGRMEEMEREMESIRAQKGRVTPAEGYARLSRILKRRK
jgi:hypothetical protein